MAGNNVWVQDIQMLDSNGSAKTNAAGENAVNAVIDGLSSNQIRVNAGNSPYTGSTIKGFRIVNIGTGALRWKPNTTGAADIVITNAELVLMGVNAYTDWPVAASSITAGAAVELVVYI